MFYNELYVTNLPDECANKKWFGCHNIQNSFHLTSSISGQLWLLSEWFHLLVQLRYWKQIEELLHEEVISPFDPQSESALDMQ